MQYRFGPHLLDLGTLELSCNGELVELEPQALQVLARLVEHRARVVSKEELLDEVWGDRFVSESALTTRIKQVRRAVGDDGRRQAVIRTSHGVGYRFVAEVHEGPGATGDGTRQRLAVSAPTDVHSRPVFGRDRTVGALRDRLEGQRLVTVTGVGGVGKSTLVAQLLATRPGGSSPAWWCELANTRDPAALSSVVLAAIGEAQQPDADPLESLVRALHRREVLLVFDNCEHLADAAADVVVEVLQRCPQISIVATSRVPLQVPWESVLPLGPLELDDAVACFCGRALDAGVEVEHDSASVLELCRRLDGIPLAIELAASRIRSLAPSQMVQLLHYRFRMLADPAADDADRQRSLRRTIEWSWEALGPGDRELLATLSVVVGACTLDDAVAVSRDDGDLFEVADALERLVQASLVVSSTGPDGTRRFRLLESIRDFVAEKLDDPAAARRRHRRHFAARAQALDDGLLQSEDIDRGLAEMRAMWDNLRAAVRYASDDADHDTVRRIIRAVGPTANLYLDFEVLDWCEAADLDLGASPDDEALVADAMAIQARFFAYRGALTRAHTIANAAYDTNVSYLTTLSLIWCAYFTGDYERVIDAVSRLRALCRSTTGMDAAFARGFEAIIANASGEPVPDDLDVTPETASQGILGTLECYVAGLRLRDVDLDRGTELLEAVADAAQSKDYRLLLGSATSMVVQATVQTRPLPEATRSMRRVLQMYRERGVEARILNADIIVAARVLADAGDTATATRLLAAHDASGFAHRGLPERTRAELSEELRAVDEARFDECATDGGRLRPQEAAEVAIAALDRQAWSLSVGGDHDGRG